MSNEGVDDRLEAVSTEVSKMSGLTEWIMWFAVLSIASAAVVVPVIGGSSTDITPIGRVFYVLIIGVAIVTLFRSFFDAVHIQRETRLASIQVKDLIQIDDISRFLEQSKPSQFRSHIDALYTIFQQDSEIVQDNLIELMQERMLARNRLSELFSSILITLGLIGTIAGLIVMVSELRGTLKSFNPDQNANVVGELMVDGGALSGLDTAFYTTLLGAVFGGVMLRVLTNVVAVNITRYTAFVAELSEVYVLPSLRSTARALEHSGYYHRQGG